MTLSNRLANWCWFVPVGLLSITGCPGFGANGGGGGDDSGDTGSGRGDGDGAGPGGSAQTPGDDTLVFLRRDAQSKESFHALDVSTRATRKLSDLDGGTDVTGFALSPDRQQIAFSAHMRQSLENVSLEFGPPTEAIWTMNADGTGLRQVGASIAAPPTSDCTIDSQCTPLGMECNESLKHCELRLEARQMQVAAWSPDGAQLWLEFAHSWFDSSLEGGSTLASVSSTGNAELPDLYPGVGDTCALLSNPDAHPDGRSLAAFHGVCALGRQDALVTVDVPPTGTRDLLTEAELQTRLPTAEIQVGPVRWGDATTVLFVSQGEWDFDSNGSVDGFGTALLALDVNTRQLVTIVATPTGRSFDEYALSPDGNKIAIIFEPQASVDAGDLLLIDLEHLELGLQPLVTDGSVADVDW